MSSVMKNFVTKMTDDDKLFFQELGLRIASLRKDQSMTQGQLAKHIGISQQHMASFEKGIRKLPASMLPILGALFGQSIDELMGASSSTTKRGPTLKLQRQIEQIALLPKAKRLFVSEMLDTVIQQQV